MLPRVEAGAEMKLEVLTFSVACAATLSGAAEAACSSATPSTLQSSYNGLSLSTAAVLAPALSSIAGLAAQEGRSRSEGSARDRRIAQLRQQVADYDARRQSVRRPLDLRNGQSLLRSMMQGATPDPPAIAAARSELKATNRQRTGESRNEDGANELLGGDTQMSQAIDRVTRDTGVGASYNMLVSVDRLMRERVADCAAWRNEDGAGLSLSLDALERYDRASQSALVGAATAAAPRIKAEIAAATDSTTIQRLMRDYSATPSATAALDRVGVSQALVERQAAIASNERSVAAAARARSDAEAARLARAEAARKAREDAAEQVLLARQRSAQGSARPATSGGGSSASSSSGEPTEDQMRAALQANAGRVASRMGVGDWTKITYFEKVGCEKAQGRVGWQCDYLVRNDGNPMTGFLDAMAGPGTAMRGSARFVLRANGWDSFMDATNN